MWADLKSSKTFWLIVAGFLGLGQQLASGEITRQQAIVGAFALLIALTMRHAIETNGAESPPTRTAGSDDARQDGPPTPMRSGAILLACALALTSGCHTISTEARHQIAVDAAASAADVREWYEMDAAKQRRSAVANAKDWAALDYAVNGTPIPDELK